MRNGNTSENPASDRGSAILSTLPLSEPIAVELPGERQRRVAIIATIALPSAELRQQACLGWRDSPRRTRCGDAFVGVLDTLDARAAGQIAGSAAARRPARPRCRPEYVAREEMNPPSGCSTGDSGKPRHRTNDKVSVFAFWTICSSVPATIDARANEQLAQTYGSDHRPLIGWFE